MAAKTRQRLTDEQRAQRRAQDRERLQQAAERLLTSEGWQQWVRLRARNGLRRYSVGNQLLIAMQAPDATFIVGFHAWKDLGRRVSKGEHGIRILAPMLLVQDPGDASPTEGEAKGDGDNVRVLFKSVAVFDVAQTEPIPGRPQVPFQPPREAITGDSHAGLLAPLERFAAELGYTVRQAPIRGTTGGWCDPAKQEIVVNDLLPANARVRVMVHELAHALGIGYADRGRARAEVMVDCVVFRSCQARIADLAVQSVGNTCHRRLIGRLRGGVRGFDASEEVGCVWVAGFAFRWAEALSQLSAWVSVSSWWRWCLNSASRTCSRVRVPSQNRKLSLGGMVSS